jgi:hypothetical protein
MSDPVIANPLIDAHTRAALEVLGVKVLDVENITLKCDSCETQWLAETDAPGRLKHFSRSSSPNCDSSYPLCCSIASHMVMGFIRLCSG